MRGGLRIAATLLVLCLGSVTAQADDQSDRVATATEVLNELHSADMVSNILPTLIAQIKTNLTHGDPDLVKAFDAYEPHLREEADATRPALMDKLTAVYAKTFTLDELKDMLAYYKSPVGQRIIASQSAINHEMLTAARDWGLSVAQTLARDAAAKLQGPQP